MAQDPGHKMAERQARAAAIREQCFLRQIRKATQAQKESALRAIRTAR